MGFLCRKGGSDLQGPDWPGSTGGSANRAAVQRMEQGIATCGAGRAAVTSGVAVY